MPLSIAQAFGSALRNLRRQADITQEELAENSRLSRVTLWKVENGEVVASLETLYRIARGLGLSLTQVMAATEEQLGELGEDGKPKPARRLTTGAKKRKSKRKAS